jgi:spore coat protein U-like protein
MSRSSHALCLLLLGMACPMARAVHCSVSTVGVAFSAYNVFSTTNDDVSGSVTVSCSASATYRISLSKGSGTFASRLMHHGTNALSYNLFTDTQRLMIWGDGSSGTVVISGTGTGQSYPVYGRIPARQNVRGGSYSDTVTVTVTY